MHATELSGDETPSSPSQGKESHVPRLLKLKAKSSQSMLLPSDCCCDFFTFYAPALYF